MVKTNWVVITGRPRSGKTKVIERLAWSGFRTCPESARVILDDKLSKNINLDFSTNEFETALFLEKLMAEDRFNPQEFVFWDRCPLDSIAFSYLYQKNLEQEFASKLKYSYKHVFFMCELDEYISDYATYESKENAILLENILYNTYEQSGYNLIKIAAMDIGSRVDLILTEIGLK
jgi:predicted ATPase